MSQPLHPVVAAAVDLAEQALAGLPAADRLQRARQLHLREGQAAVAVAAGLAALTLSEHLQNDPGTQLELLWEPPADPAVLLALGGHARVATLAHDVGNLLTNLSARDPAVL